MTPVAAPTPIAVTASTVRTGYASNSVLAAKTLIVSTHLISFQCWNALAMWSAARKAFVKRSAVLVAPTMHRSSAALKHLAKPLRATKTTFPASMITAVHAMPSFSTLKESRFAPARMSLIARNPIARRRRKNAPRQEAGKHDPRGTL